MGNTHLVLLPIAYNDGSLVPDDVFDCLIRELSVKFGGCTLLPPALGGWIDSDGKFQPEKHRPMAIDVEPGREEELIEWVKKSGEALDQEVMLVMKNFCEASFIEIRSW